MDKLQAVAGSDSNIVYARSKGIVTIVQAFTKDAASAAGLAGAALAPVFIILDLVNGNFQSAAFGLVGAALGLAVSFGGPIGFAVGAVLAVLFVILPGLFDHPDVNPPANNATEVRLLHRSSPETDSLDYSNLPSLVIRLIRGMKHAMRILPSLINHRIARHYMDPASSQVCSPGSCSMPSPFYSSSTTGIQ